MILAWAVCVWADDAVTSNDPIEVVRAWANARMTGGDWRAYLSGRLQGAISPAAMQAINQYEQSRKQSQPDTFTPQVQDLALSRLYATDTTAIVDYSWNWPDGEMRKAPRQYLIKEGGRWAIDSVAYGLRPEWAEPANLKPIRDEVTLIINEFDAALYDSQGWEKPNRKALEEFAKKHLAAESLASIGASGFAQDIVKKARGENYQNLSPAIIDILGRYTGDHGLLCARVVVDHVYVQHNRRGETVAEIGVQALIFQSERGEWKWLVEAVPTVPKPVPGKPSTPPAKHAGPTAKPVVPVMQPAVPPAKLVPPPADLPVELRARGDRGGIYFDDILLTNNGNAVVFDDFESGNLSGWLTTNDATVESSSSGPRASCLYLNHQADVVSEAFHAIFMEDPGVVELSAWVWLPPADEQGPAKFTNLMLYSRDGDNIAAGVKVDRQQTGYLITLHWNRHDGDHKDAVSNGSVLKPGKWARLMLRLDKGSETASALLDGVTQASFPYVSSNFATMRQMSVWGWLGAVKNSK